MSVPRKFLVLGGRGFLGSKIALALFHQGAEVRVLDRPLPAIAQMKSWQPESPKFEVVEGDFANERDLFSAMRGCDVCIHAVTTTLPKSSNEDILFDVSTNLLGTIGVLDAAVKCHVKKVVFLSSGGTVYGLPESSYLAEDHPTNPISSYGITKLAIEKYLFLYERLHGLKSIALRLSNPYGPGQRLSGAQGAVAVFLGAALRGEAIKIWGAGEVVRDYVYVDDVVDAVLGTIEYAGESRVFNIGSGVGLDLIEVVEAIERAVKTTMTKEFLPARGFDVPRNVLDISLAKNELNWVPQVDFDSGVERMAVWAKELLTNSHGDQN